MNVGELTMEDALALLAAVDSDSDAQQMSMHEHSSRSSTSSSSGDCSPLLTGDELKLALWSSSEFSWSDPDDGDVVDLFFPSPSSESPISDSSHSDGSVGTDPQTQQLASLEASTTAAPRTAQRQQKTKPTAKKLPPSLQSQLVHHRKRKAALSTRCGATTGDTESERGRQPKSAKTELLELREVAVELQLRLAQLQRRRTRSESSAPHSPATMDALALPMASTGWLESAMDEFKALQKAEELNATLKAEVHRQTGLSKNLQVLFTKKVAQQCGTLDFVTALKPIATEGALPLPESTTPTIGATVVDAKPPRAETMHIDADTVRRQIAAESDVDSVFSSLKTRNDATLGLVMELRTNTPIPFPDFQLLARLFWTHARQSNGTSVADPAHHFASEMYERPVSMTVPSPIGELVVAGVMVMCKVEEADRTIMTIAATLAVTTRPKLRFREHGWLITTAHASDASVSLLQTFSQVYADVGGSLSDAENYSNDDAKLRAAVLHTLGEKLRAFYSELQLLVLSKDETAAIAGFERSCPLDDFKRMVLG